MAVIWIKRIRNSSALVTRKGVAIELKQRHGLWRPTVDDKLRENGVAFTVAPDDRLLWATGCLITNADDGAFELSAPGGKLAFSIVAEKDADHLRVTDARGHEVVKLKLGGRGAVFGTEYDVQLTIEQADVVFRVIDVRGITGVDAEVRAQVEKTFKEASRALFYALSTSAADLIRPAL